MNGIINKSRCASLHRQCEGGGSKICFNNRKIKLVPKPRRLCRQRKMLSVIISEVAFADHKKIPTVRKWLLWLPNPHNSPNKWHKHDVRVQGFQWNTVGTWAGKPRAHHKSVRWIKVHYYPAMYCVLSDAAQFFGRRPKGNNVRK